VLIIDVLYQMPAEAQLDLLARAAASARSRLVARVFDPTGLAQPGRLALGGRDLGRRPLPPRLDPPDADRHAGGGAGPGRLRLRDAALLGDDAAAERAPGGAPPDDRAGAPA
jgi:hypothetical protein